MSKLLAHPFRIIAIAAFIAAAGACGSDNVTAPDQDNIVTVFINNSVYSPNPLHVNLGVQVNWKNNDSVTHSATTTSGPISFDVGDISPNSAHGAPVLMTTRGTINYHCKFHGETGVIIVE